jgi:hypothetical protein
MLKDVDLYNCATLSKGLAHPQISKMTVCFKNYNYVEV